MKTFIRLLRPLRLFRLLRLLRLFHHLRFPILLILLVLLASCRTPQPVAHHADSLRIESHQYDSIDRWHTLTVFQQGDTVYQTEHHYIDRWHTRYLDSVRTIHDSIPYAVEVVKTETDRTGWWCFAALSAVCLLIIAFRLLRLFRVL